MSTIESREREIERRFEEMSNRASKSLTYQEGLQWDQDFKQLKADRDALERDKKIAKIDGSARGNGDIATRAVKTGRDLSPLTFADADLKAMFKAAKNRQSMSIEAKGFSTVDSLLPSELAPGVLEHQHEWRILDKLPSRPMTGPTIEFIQHNFASDTGTNSSPFAGVVVEGGTKPEWVPAATSQTATAVKSAMHTGISYETLADFPTWLGYVQSEAMRLMMDKENQQLLYGTGSSGQILGLSNVSGILTHDASADGAGATPLDSVEIAINQLRVGNALAEPTLFITHPTTWSSMRRTKSTTNQYILGDPLHDAVQSLWGIPTLITTACSIGDGYLLDTNKFGYALIREGITMHQGFSGTDFVENVCRYVFEERISLAVERPQAVLALSNLPTS